MNYSDYVLEIDSYKFHISNVKYCEYDGWFFNVSKIMDGDVEVTWDDLSEPGEVYYPLLEELLIKEINKEIEENALDDIAQEYDYNRN